MAVRHMGLADVWPMLARTSERETAVGADVAVLEDQAEMANLAAEMCSAFGLTAATYHAPTSFLADFRDVPPRLVILDWRLERELGAAAFMAVRHRFGDVPIVCWTATPAHDLPAMVAGDEATRVVPKTSGVDGFEAAVRWALSPRGARQEETRS